MRLVRRRVNLVVRRIRRCTRPQKVNRCDFDFTGNAVSPLLDRTGGSSIKTNYKGHSPDPPTLVVKWMETLSRDVTWLRSDAF